MADLIYQGSVKNLWRSEPGTLEFEYTDAYSVFDWGRMPDELAYKGESLAALGAFFFEAMSERSSWSALAESRWFGGFASDPAFSRLLSQELRLLVSSGLKSHFLGRTAPNRLRVREVSIHRPLEHVLGTQRLVHYAQGGGWTNGTRLIPLEVVFRFGMPKGSSLVERLTPEYARALGLPGIPREGALFSRPVLEFFTKLEDTDRFLTWEQALNYSGLGYVVFEQLVTRTILLSMWLESQFARRGLELWDGKFEWALIDGELTLVDSIGPDELRLQDPASGVQISKEFLRRYYRDTPWFEAVKDAKKRAALDPALDWKEAVVRKVGEAPRLDDAFREAADALYPSLVLAMTGRENPGGLGVELPRLLEKVNRCLRR